MDLRDVCREGVDWMRLDQVRDQWGGTCEHGNEPLYSINCGEFLD
jgi:hypothetical protein